jgi:hypothetical protein
MLSKFLNFARAALTVAFKVPLVAVENTRVIYSDGFRLSNNIAGLVFALGGFYVLLYALLPMAYVLCYDKTPEKMPGQEFVGPILIGLAGVLGLVLPPALVHAFVNPNGHQSQYEKCDKVREAVKKALDASAVRILAVKTAVASLTAVLATRTLKPEDEERVERILAERANCQASITRAKTQFGKIGQTIGKKTIGKCMGPE